VRPRVDFTNTLSTAFMRSDPKGAKKTNSLSIFFVLLGPAHLKAGHKCL